MNINHKTFIIYTSKYIQKLVQKHIGNSVKLLGRIQSMNVNFNTSIINRNRTHLSSLISHLQIQVSFDHVAWLSGLSVIVKRTVVSNGVWHFDNLHGNHHQSYIPELRQKIIQNGKMVTLPGLESSVNNWKLSMYQEKKTFYVYIREHMCHKNPLNSESPCQAEKIMKRKL